MLAMILFDVGRTGEVLGAAQDGDPYLHTGRDQTGQRRSSRE
jgi:hypothetical protein